MSSRDYQLFSGFDFREILLGRSQDSNSDSFPLEHGEDGTYKNPKKFRAITKAEFEFPLTNPHETATGLQNTSTDLALSSGLLLPRMLIRSTNAPEARGSARPLESPRKASTPDQTARLEKVLPVAGCVFCRKNGETREFYSTHQLKDRRGVVICPVLRAYVCPHCGKTGDFAHTSSHCPLSGNATSVVSTLRTRRSSCGIKHSHSLPVFHSL